MIGNLTTAALFQGEHRQVVRITVARESAPVIYALLSDGTEQVFSEVELSDGTTATLSELVLDEDPYNFNESRILQGGMTVDSYSMTGERIEIGSAIASELTLNLMNSDGLFDPMVFCGKEIFVEVGTKDWSTDDPITYIPLGYYTVDNEPKDGAEIKLTALDRMVSKLDVTIDWTQFTFPMTVQTLVSTVCTVCGITCATDLTTLPNYNYSITSSPEGACTMYRELIQYAAFMTATCAQFDENGHLRFKWYTSTGFSLTTANRFSHDIENDDITLSGIHYVDNNGLEYLSGTADYTLENSRCAILQNNIDTALANILSALTPFSYRPFEAEIITAPFLQPMDMVSFTDARGSTHTCIISHVNYKLNNSTMVAGKGDTKVTTEYAPQSGLTDQQTIAVDDARRQATNYLSQDATGIMVANMTDGNRYTPSTVPSGVKNTFIDSDSFDVRDGTDTLASFGETTLIGKDGANLVRTRIAAGSFQIIDTNGDVLASIGKERSIAREAYKIHYNFGTRSNHTYGVYSFVQGEENGAAFDSQSAFGKYGRYGYRLTNDIKHVTDQEPTLTYDVSSYIAMGFTEDDIEVTIPNVESFTWSLSSGIITITVSSSGTLDVYANVTVTIGKDIAFSIGNGTEEERSDAIEFTWDGNMMMALDTTASAGTTDGDLYAAITALGWESEVIV